MGRLVIGVLFGLVLGFGGALFIGSGVVGGAMGTGIATGLSAGICSVVEAANQSGLLTPDQIEQILTRAAENMQTISGEKLPETTGVAGSVGECQAFMNDLRAAR